MRKWLLGLVSCFFVAGVYANALTIVEGQHYVTLPKEVRQHSAVQTYLQQDPGKIQVVEFFSYKCPGCYALENTLTTWIVNQPKDVVVRRVPVAFRPNWEALAKTYYALDELKVLGRVSPLIFAAIHKQHKPLDTQEEIAAFLATQGITPAQFNTAYQGFNVSRQWVQAQALRTAEQVSVVPTIVVNGEYVTDLSLTNDPVLLTQVVDHLIAKVRLNK